MWPGCDIGPTCLAFGTVQQTRESDPSGRQGAFEHISGGKQQPDSEMADPTPPRKASSEENAVAGRQIDREM
jgi:hypothetical protein